MGLSLGFCLYLVALAGAQDICQVPSFPPLNSTDDRSFDPNIQYIIPTMNFTGCGVITDWTIVGAGYGAGNVVGNTSRIIELQLFRPDPTPSNVFTKVTGSVMTTNIDRQIKNTHTFTSIGFTFSSGDVLGFHYTRLNGVGILRVFPTTSFSTHSLLTSANSPAANVVTATAPAGTSSLYVPLMSVSVSCTECPRSTTILPSVNTSTTPILTNIPSSTETLPLLPFTSSSIAMTSSVHVTTDTATVSSRSANVSSNTVTVFQSATLASALSSQSLFISGTSLSESTLSPGVPGTTTVPDVSDEVSIAAVAGGAAGGALAVLLIVIIVLIAVTVICFSRKKRKHTLYAHYTSTSSEPITFINAFNPVEIIKQSNTSNLPGDDGYFEIPDDLDHKPCTASETLNPDTPQFCYDVPNNNAVIRNEACHSSPTDKRCEGHEYAEPDEIPKGGEPPAAVYNLPRKVPAQSMYDRVPTREERLRFPEPGSNKNVYESPLVHFETLGRQKVFVNGIPEGIYKMSFCKEEKYCSPSENEDGVYSQMAKWGYKEIPDVGVRLSKKLGEGHFGEVYKAELKVSKERNLHVAVKLVKKGAPAEERTKLLQEAATLGQFKHKHVVRLIGVVTLGEPKMMLMELLPKGNLKEYLMTLHENPSQLSSPDLPSLLLQFCKQVADGLAYLTSKSFVHRDIAARNILLDKDRNCKISDFGMTRQVESNAYYTMSKSSRVPAKWTSPEALLYKKYSTSSDVWSYGMLMYEIWSLGHKPFEDKTIEEMIKCLDKRYCHPPPPGCPRAVYEVMVKCWNLNHNDRPSASDISGEFCKSERILLSWKKEDIVSPSAQVLGGPLSNGEELYKDLQFLYQENPEL